MPASARRHAAPLGLILFLAAQSLRAGPLSTLLLVVAVAAGVGFQVPNTANLLGYRGELLEQGVLRGFGDVRVRPARGLVFRDGDGAAETLRRDPAVHAVTTLLAASGSIAAKDREIPTPVLGVDPGAARAPYRLVEGEPLVPGDGAGALVGSNLAARLGLHVGDVIEVRAILGEGLSPAAADLLAQACALGLPVDCSRARAGAEIGLKRFPMRVRGIAGGVFSAHEAVLVDLTFLRGESRLPRGASTLLVYADDPPNARALAARLAGALPGAEALAWMDDSHYLSSSVDSVAAIAAVSHAMVVSAVVIPVWALLYVNVLARRREIGVLSALGLGRMAIFLVFLAQALLVAAAGALLGCALGYGLVRWFTAHPIFEFDGFAIRPTVTALSFVEPALVVLAAAVIAGVIPAVRASRLDPARILRRL